MALCAVMLVPSIVDAAQAFIWNYDPLDKYFDPEVGDSIDGTYWLEHTLNINGHTFFTDTVLPHNLDTYDVIFVTLGWFRC